MSKFSTAIQRQPDPTVVQAFLAGADTPAVAKKIVEVDKTELCQVNVRVSKDHWLKLKMFCLKEGITMQEWLIAGIEKLEG